MARVKKTVEKEATETKKEVKKKASKAKVTEKAVMKKPSVKKEAKTPVVKTKEVRETLVTKEGLEKLKAEMQELRTVKRAENKKRLKEAIKTGDKSETSEYAIAKAEQARLEGRIKELQNMIKTAKVIEYGKKVDTKIQEVKATETIKDKNSKSKDSYVYIRPQAVKMERDDDGKAIGLTVSGFRSPDGEYYKIHIPFQSKDGKVTSKILSKQDTMRFAGWGFVKFDKNAVLDMKNSKGEEATLDMQAFKKFIDNKNHKIEQQLQAKQEKLNAGRDNVGVAGGR